MAPLISLYENSFYQKPDSLSESENLLAIKKKITYAEGDISKLRIIQSETDSVFSKYVMSVLAACVAESVTYPLDLTKTRLQLQGEVTALSHKSKSLPYRGTLQTLFGIAKEEGLRCCWKGMAPALLRHSIYTGMRMTSYEQIRNRLVRKDKNGFPLWKKVLAGMAAGGFGQLVASPTDLVKTQLQMEGKRRLLGLPPRIDGMFSAFKKIIQVSGVSGLWRGSWPNVQRAALVNLGDLSTYDAVKSSILRNTKLKDNYTTHCLSSFFAGLVGALLGTPADVIKARIMNQPTDSRGCGILYKNSFDCLSKTITNEGFTGIYKGFVPCWMRMAPWSLTFWISFEQIRRQCGTQGW